MIAHTKFKSVPQATETEGTYNHLFTYSYSLFGWGWGGGRERLCGPASFFTRIFFLIKQPVFSVAPKVLVWGLKKRATGSSDAGCAQSLSCTHLKPTQPVKGGSVWTESVLFRCSSTFSIKARLSRLLKKFRLEGCLQQPAPLLPSPICLSWQPGCVCLAGANAGMLNWWNTELLILFSEASIWLMAG